MKIEMPIENLQAIEEIQTHLDKLAVAWLVGGSCGLLLQGVPIEQSPRDLDIYADMADAHIIHAALQEFATDQPVFSETGIYVSLLSHYRINGVSIELVGGFEVHAGESHYKVEVSNFLLPIGASYILKGRAFGLMPLAHELVFNLLRQRPDRYQAIADRIINEPNQHLMALNKLEIENDLSSEITEQIHGLLERKNLYAP